MLGYNEPFYVQQWSGDTLAWARAEGCTAPLKPYVMHYGDTDDDTDSDSEIEDHA
jgi:hypothetical protein